MTSLSDILIRNKLLAAVGVAGCAFVGYAIYFDYKRTHSPNYKEKIRENRKRKTKQNLKSKGTSKMPDPTNMEEMQNFFLQEVQLGEELMTEGMISDGLDHLSNAIVLCAHPQQLLAIFNQTLPAEHFQMLISRIPEAKQRVALMFGSQVTSDRGEPINISDDSEGLSMTFMPARTDGTNTTISRSGATGMVDPDDLE